MKKVICNIPHSSTIIPEWAIKDIIISRKELNSLIDYITDKDVDKIWKFVPDLNKSVATVSRLIVDTERFRNDADEVMSLKGMGLYYTHTPDGKQFRIKNEDSYTKCLSIYDTYHENLERKVTECLKEYNKCIILDCHSFHDEMNYTEYKPENFPDICIGINGEITAEAKYIIDTFKSKGYITKINEPFAGSLVPLKYFNDSRVISVMIELNRRVYDNSSFKDIQDICKEIYNELNN